MKTKTKRKNFFSFEGVISLHGLDEGGSIIKPQNSISVLIFEETSFFSSATELSFESKVIFEFLVELV